MGGAGWVELANSFLGEEVGVEMREEEKKNAGEKIARGKIQGQTDTWLQKILIPVSSILDTWNIGTAFPPPLPTTTLPNPLGLLP